jgi:hypothetical protein
MQVDLIIASVYACHLAIWLGALVYYIKSPKAAILNPLTPYHLFYFIVFILRPFAVHFLNFDSMLINFRHPIERADHIVAMIAITTSMLVFQVVVLHMAPVARVVHNISIKTNATAKLSLSWTWLVLGPLALLSIIKSGGYESMVRDETSGLMVYATGSGYFSDANLMFLSLSLVLMIVQRRWYASVPLAVYMVYFLFAAIQRWAFVVATIAAIATITHFSNWRRAFVTGVVAASLVLPIFYLKGEDRELFRNYYAGGSERVADLAATNYTFSERYDKMDFAHYDFVSLYVAAFPRSTGGYTWFTQWLQLFTEPIPRVLWQSKPYGSPVKMFDIEMMDIANWTGISPTMVGSGWMSLGIAGVIITAAISGLIIGKIYQLFRFNQNNVYATTGYILFYSVIFQYYRDGDISIFKFLLWLLIPWGLWTFVSMCMGDRMASPREFLRRQAPMQSGKNTNGRIERS